MAQISKDEKFPTRAFISYDPHDSDGETQQRVDNPKKLDKIDHRNFGRDCTSWKSYYHGARGRQKQCRKYRK